MTWVYNADKKYQITTVSLGTTAYGTSYTRTVTRNSQRKDIEFALKEYVVTVQMACNCDPGYEVSEYHTFDRKVAASIINDATENVLTIYAEVRDLFGNCVKIVPKLNFEMREAVLTAIREDEDKVAEALVVNEDKVVTVDTVGELATQAPAPFHHRKLKVWCEDWAAAEYRRKRDKAIRELSRHGHPEPVNFKVGDKKYTVTLCPQIFGNHKAFKITTASGQLKEVK